ncbi:MAG: VWA domain-containing protein, partial [Candidatus Obscuribacterales bacterium]|nr:VWA domain-containing protein [Candidatus Obscuribacterales bacterium]
YYPTPNNNYQSLGAPTAANGLKGMLLDKVKSMAGFSGPGYSGSNNYYPSNNSYTPPSSGFYSIEQGAPLGGVDYSPVSMQGFAQPAYNPTAFSSSASDAPVAFAKKLAPTELKQLSRYDISVLIDSSGSMSTKDCPDQIQFGNTISRWEWCRQQTTMLARQTAGAMPAGITILPFANNWNRFSNASVQDINRIFSGSKPDGSTNLANALKAELDRYFQERDSGMRSRPLMITIITDGAADNKGAIRRMLQAANSRLNRADELKVVFFLIGEDQSGADFVDQLAHEQNLNIVSEHTFNEVNNLGLPRSLVMSLNNRSSF